jgi:hypothetical protein
MKIASKCTNFISSLYQPLYKYGEQQEYLKCGDLHFVKTLKIEKNQLMQAIASFMVF